MKLKSFVAIALALTLGLGFSSCKKDEPDPDPKPSGATYTFQNNIAINADLTNYMDITLELTDVDGKTTTTDITKLNTEKFSYTNPMTSETKEYTMYVFKNTGSAEKAPVQTTLKLNFSAKVTVPAEKFDQVILYDFKVKGSSATQINTEQFIKNGLNLDEAKFKSFVENLNKIHTVVMKVAADGKPSIE
ncbi:MAG: hypothetical protein HUK14_03545 [Muribaculaceae bacterium]|nr:hypothetical protein [Muribaculaceae bacterium]